MSDTDFKGAKKHIEKILRNLPDTLFYHNFEHSKQVEKAAYILGRYYGLNNEDCNLLSICATAHDLGFKEQYNNNEPIAVEMIRNILPKYDFNEYQVERIANGILATSVPQKPNDLFEKIMVDADLDNLWRPQFFERTDLLFRELVFRGNDISKREWDRTNIYFLRKHKYFTNYKEEERLKGKRLNARIIYDSLNPAKE